MICNAFLHSLTRLEPRKVLPSTAIISSAISRDIRYFAPKLIRDYANLDAFTVIIKGPQEIIFLMHHIII